MEFLLEIVLVLLLALTLFHALRLERALGVLQRDRAALEELIASFNASSRQAEQGVERLRTAADGAGRQIARQVETASGLKEDLLFLVERGERLADRLDGLVRLARPLAPEVSRPERGFASLPMDQGMTEPPRPLATQDGGDGAPRLRSQAERDLLKALRTAR
jgi:hypothetical protein